METSVKSFLDYLNKPENNKSNNLFDEPTKISLQVCLHKMPNLINQKTILCPLPHPLFNSKGKDSVQPEICLIVKDIDKKDRDYEGTIRKYNSIIEKHKLNTVIKQVGFIFDRCCYF
jgi:hypothetical protein